MARMNPVVDIKRFERRLLQIDQPEWKQSRVTSLFAASLAAADCDTITQSIRVARSSGVAREQLYEVILQSYLFLGFPRMLIGAGELDTNWPVESRRPTMTEAISPDEATAWFENGLSLCRKIYGDSFEPLRERVERIAPEAFRWMIIEGYGKVLSRNGLALIDRELCIIGSLIIENRPDQLHSHLRGAINAGASQQLVKTVLDDLGEPAGEGYQTALKLFAENGPGQ